MKRIILFTAGVLICVVQISAAYAQQTVKEVPLAELTGSPALHDGQTVRVKGFLLMRFENRALYPSSDEVNRRKALWVANTLDIANRIREMSGQYVVVEGIIDARSYGHLNKFAGTIVVTKVDPESGR